MVLIGTNDVGAIGEARLASLRSRGGPKGMEEHGEMSMLDGETAAWEAVLGIANRWATACDVMLSVTLCYAYLSDWLYSLAATDKCNKLPAVNKGLQVGGDSGPGGGYCNCSSPAIVYPLHLARGHDVNRPHCNTFPARCTSSNSLS